MSIGELGKIRNGGRQFRPQCWGMHEAAPLQKIQKYLPVRPRAGGLTHGPANGLREARVIDKCPVLFGIAGGWKDKVGSLGERRGKKLMNNEEIQCAQPVRVTFA